MPDSIYKYLWISVCCFMIVWFFFISTYNTFYSRQLDTNEHCMCILISFNHIHSMFFVDFLSANPKTMHNVSQYPMLDAPLKIHLQKHACKPVLNSVLVIRACKVLNVITSCFTLLWNRSLTLIYVIWTYIE